MASNLDRLREANTEHEVLKAREDTDSISGLTKTPEHLNQEQFSEKPITPETDFDGNPMPKEWVARQRGEDEAEAHQKRMAGMSTKERNEYMAGLRGGLQRRDKNGVPQPRRGDFDNPLRRDQPPEPKPPRPASQPRQPRPPRQPSPMANVRKLNALARKARGRRR